MKTYRIEHTRPGADDPCDDWVPAEVAQRLYGALEDLMNCGAFIPGFVASDEAQDKARVALAAADGEEV